MRRILLRNALILECEQICMKEKRKIEICKIVMWRFFALLGKGKRKEGDIIVEMGSCYKNHENKCKELNHIDKIIFANKSSLFHFETANTELRSIEDSSVQPPKILFYEGKLQHNIIVWSRWKNQTLCESLISVVKWYLHARDSNRHFLSNYWKENHQ